MSTTLQSRAMLASLSISQWTASRFDRAISQEVAHSKGATSDAGRYTVKLSNASVLEDISKSASKARLRHIELTLPWGDNGLRLLPSNLYFQHVKVMNEVKLEFLGHCARLFQEWPAIIAAEQIGARLGHGRIFDPANYPPLEQLKSKYGFRVNILPVPDAADFRVSLSEEEEQRIRQDITESVQESMSHANRDVWQRLYTTVSHLAERLEAYGPGSRLRDSVVGNLVELVDILPGLNIGQDPTLDALAQEARLKLCGLKIEELRDSPTLRGTAVSSAQAILDKMKDYVA